MRTLVTGAAGFIGSTLVDRLLAEGDEVVAVDSLVRGRLENLTTATRSGRSFTFVQCDVTSPDFCNVVAATEPRVVFHLAAQIDVRVSVADPLYDARVNVLGTVNVLEAARRAAVTKVVFTSSGGSIYGQQARLPVPERATLQPNSPYAASKIAGEFYLNAFESMYGLRHTSLALGNVYGPRQDPYGEAGVVAIFARALLEGRPTAIFGDGTAARDYVYVDDVVDAFIAVAGATGDGRRYNIGTGRTTTVRDLHSLIAKAARAADRPVLTEPRPGELQSISLDCSAARTELNWLPVTTLERGVAQTVEWIRGHMLVGVTPTGSSDGPPELPPEDH